ncbi:MAG TPA: Glu-tRNA(Gln) amidotransferase subunit GatE [Planctomycetota bacterium]|nr:Glu-tRNA(Gln) amidotransferase subunit GatE [Planctomycetota bacterium]HRU52534.1 Glu-tRNA(Gln) amidotransferase subunit GatE [Planctomycetota bacterium]
MTPQENYQFTMQAVGYIPRTQAQQQDYDRMGFKAGLEVHQQLKTKRKLFCNCPAGLYHKKGLYDLRIVRYMRPTLSELGQYDSSALTEFKTNKKIIYQIVKKTACTYETDDTPPFTINKEALEIALEISLLCKSNIVGEVHISRKQYVDGSIPAGFQRTAILGLEGEIPLKNKKLKLIQLSIEEDSCREVSDSGHVRIFQTDRFGTPLIETVTYPDLVSPEEVREACEYIRYLNRSTGKVRTGIGSARQDVNVSCQGGERNEIKGVAHTAWIPEITHNEVFRQWALLRIRDLLKEKIENQDKWTLTSCEIDPNEFSFTYQPIIRALSSHKKLIAINLPKFAHILSHFTQPNHIFADEISGQLKVIACLDQPNMLHSEQLQPVLKQQDWEKIQEKLQARDNDAQILIWAPENDIDLALEYIEKRCKAAFLGVSRETRKALKDGTTIFERFLPSADRMYPDTDSPALPLEDEYIEKLRSNIPDEIIDRAKLLDEWEIPEEWHSYIFRNNIFPTLQRIIDELLVDPKVIAKLFAHQLRRLEGKNRNSKVFDYNHIYRLVEYILQQGLDMEIAKIMLPIVYEYPQMDFDSVLTYIHYKRYSKDDILNRIPFLADKFIPFNQNKEIAEKARVKWMIGQLRKMATGNISFPELEKYVTNRLKSWDLNYE